MGAKKVDLTGKKFGKLTVLGYSHSNKYAYWKCKCECGNETTVRSSHLILGAIKTCGCSWAENGKKTIMAAQEANKKYGEYSNSRLYTIWNSMKERCSGTKNKDYGGRGITICPDWENDFIAFYDWAMKNGYADELSIDRVDNNKGYYPENCRWVNRIVQANNTRRNSFITFNGVKKTIAQWSREYNIPYSTFLRWVRKGYNFEDILNKSCGRVKKASA